MRTVLAVVLACLFVSSAEARSGLHPMCNITMPCVVPYASTPAKARATRGAYVAHEMGFGAPVRKRHARTRKGRERVSHGWRDTAQTYVAGIVAPLAAKVAEIKSACGSIVTPHGGVRNTYVRGTRRISLHASGKAVDLAGNAPCIYSMLHGWPGGYSVDYSRVRHVHLSYDPNGREWGLRFAHRGHRTRYARHRHHRYAER